MSKAKGKGGTGRGTDKKGWNRWKAGANKAKSAKPYVSKGAQKSDEGKKAPTNHVDKLKFPNDADGEALRSLQKDGIDFSKQQTVDFFVVVPDKKSGESLTNILKEEGFTCFLEQDDETEEWECRCSKKMLLEHQVLVETQNKLERLSKPYDGFSDGWGVFVE